MQLMEAKLKQLKAKKDVEEARKKAKAAAMSNPSKMEAAVEATKAVQQRAQQGAMPQQGVNVMAQHAGNMMQHGASLMPQAPARRDNGPPVRYVDSRDTSRDSNPPAAALAMQHPQRPLGIRASVDSSAHGSVPSVAVRLHIHTHTHAAAGALCFPLSWPMSLHPCAAPGLLAGPSCACLSFCFDTSALHCFDTRALHSDMPCIVA
jgi:hypothetical protein